MVSRLPSAAPSRARLFAAAAAEFAARGFDGAKVDRIAARAGINKAMLYYHFGSKAALYREILRDMFGGVAASVAQAREQGGPPDAQLRAFVAAVQREAAARAHFPAIWLRELAEGGRHLDEDAVQQMRRVIGTLAAILGDGARRGQFAPVHPFVIHIGIVAPILFLAASAPLRARFAHLLPALPAADAVIAHVLDSTLAAVAVAPARRARPRRSTRRSRR